jgi:hypothetical protein
MKGKEKRKERIQALADPRKEITPRMSCFFSGFFFEHTTPSSRDQGLPKKTSNLNNM